MGFFRSSKKETSNVEPTEQLQQQQRRETENVEDYEYNIETFEQERRNRRGSRKTLYHKRRSSGGVSNNSSTKSASNSAKTIKCGTKGIRNLGGSHKTATTGSSSRSQSMRLSIDKVRTMYRNDLSEVSDMVSDLDLESAEMLPIGESSYEEELKRIAGLGPQDEPQAQQGTDATSSEFPSNDFTLASSSQQNCNNSRAANSRGASSKGGHGGGSNFGENTSNAELYDNVSVASTSVMMDKTRAENIGRPGTRFVYVVLLVTGVVLSIFIFMALRRLEEKNFELNFMSYARETAEMAETNADHTFSQLETVATTVTSEGLLERERIHSIHNHNHKVNGTGWPNVTIPHFDQRIQAFSKSSQNLGAIMLLYVPLVQQKDKDSWEHYANDHAPWKKSSTPNHHEASNRTEIVAPPTESPSLHLNGTVEAVLHLEHEHDDMEVHDVDDGLDEKDVIEMTEDDIMVLDDDESGDNRRRRMRYNTDPNPTDDSHHHDEEEEHVHENHAHGSHYYGNSDGFLRVHPCSHLAINEMRPQFAEVDSYMDSILSSYGGFENPEGISAPIYQYGGPGHERTENSSIALMDLWTDPIFKKEVIASIEYDVPVISEYLDVSFLMDGLSTVDPESDEVSSVLRNSEYSVYNNNALSSDDFSIGADLTLPSIRSLTLNPVKETFESDARTIGFVVGVVPWDSYFQNVVRSYRAISATSGVINKEGGVNGIVVKVVSDCGSVFTFVLNSREEVTKVRLGDWKEQYQKYKHLNHSSQFFSKEHFKGQSRHCHFDLHIYPNDEFRDAYRSMNAYYYSALVAGIFLFTGILFACYDRVIFKGQRHIVNEATGMIVENARRAAKNERGTKIVVIFLLSGECPFVFFYCMFSPFLFSLCFDRIADLNDFIAHEVRNPLAAAMSACSFVSSAIAEDEGRWKSIGDNCEISETERLALIASDEKRAEVQGDINIIDSSLHFINDLLRNMLDMQRAGSNEIHIQRKPTNIMDDIFKPVETMMHLRDVPFKVIMEVDSGLHSSINEDDLVVMTDPIRLKQVLLNLTRNATKFVEKGFIRCSANVNPINGFVEMRVDDSGPGIPPEKRNQVFGKFQESLDTLQQGTGIGLSLCKKMVDLMGGSLFIDEDYNSGIEGCRGTRFVILLKIPPLQLNNMIFTTETMANERARLRRKHLLACTEASSNVEKAPTSRSGDHTPPPTSVHQPSDSVDSSVSSSSKEIVFVSDSETSSPVQEPVAITTETTTPAAGAPPAIGEAMAGADEKQGSTMLPLPTSLRLTSTGEVIANDPPAAISSQRNESGKITELPKNLSVLFVDDDMVLRKLFSRTLRKINPTWSCKEASSGETAIELISSNAESKDGFEDEVGESGNKDEADCGFDLIFMDQYMASVQKQLLGTETVRAIRAKGFHSPIICGLSANDVEDAFYHAGSDAFMFKPFPCKKDELEKELLKVINSRIRSETRAFRK